MDDKLQHVLGILHDSVFRRFFLVYRIAWIFDGQHEVLVSLAYAELLVYLATERVAGAHVFAVPVKVNDHLPLSCEFVVHHRWDAALHMKVELSLQLADLEV